MMGDFVEPSDARPAGKPGECFYCNQAMGDPHKADCVVLKRQVMVRVSFEMPMSVVRSWDAETIDYHLNESSWCASNAYEDIAAYLASKEEEHCLCTELSFEFVGEVEG